MSYNKIDFITELLNSRKIDAAQKEKLFILTANELKKNNHSDEKILAEIEAIKNQLKGFEINTLTNTKPDKTTTSSPITDLPDYKDPTSLSKFLSAYNQHPILKYTCHTIDDSEVIDSINKLCNLTEYNLLEHQKLIEKSFNELSIKHNVKANSKLYYLILSYLTGKSYDGKNTKWSTENIDINWKSIELLKWSEMNLGIVPNPGVKMASIIKNKGFKLSKTITTNFKKNRINYFSDLVIHFKNLFHLKDDNSLKEIIENVNIYKQWENKVDFNITDKFFRKNIELFTDVDKLIQAYNKIIEIIINVSEKKNLGKPSVILSFLEVKGEIEFAIHHENSVYQKSILSAVDRIGDDQTKLIKNQINGLCDMYLKADFGQGEFAHINLWDNKTRKYKKLDSFSGVKYILKFRK